MVVLRCSLRCPTCMAWVLNLSCTVLGWFVFQGGVFVGILGVGWSFRGTKAAVGSGG